MFRMGNNNMQEQSEHQSFGRKVNSKRGLKSPKIKSLAEPVKVIKIIMTSQLGVKTLIKTQIIQEYFKDYIKDLLLTA